MDVDVGQLPIPDWGLICPRCRYPLRGLPEHRCPECGLEIDVAGLIRSWTPLRAPRFTGDELPLPDFGLFCGACQQPLAGATELRCPSCAAPFEVQTLRPAKPWFVLSGELCGPLPIPGVQALLATEGVPHVPVHEKTLSEIYGGQSMTVSRLRVPSDFYFEVLWLIQRALTEMETVRSTEPEPWTCQRCGEENPGHFELCWQCQETRSQR